MKGACRGLEISSSFMPKNFFHFKFLIRDIPITKLFPHSQGLSYFPVTLADSVTLPSGCHIISIRKKTVPYAFSTPYLSLPLTSFGSSLPLAHNSSYLAILQFSCFIRIRIYRSFRSSYYFHRPSIHIHICIYMTMNAPQSTPLNWL